LLTLTPGPGSVLGVFKLIFDVVHPGGVLVDPASGTNFLLQEDPGSPLFTAVQLPTEPGLASYELSYEIGGVWSQPMFVQPGMWEYFLQPVDAMSFDALSASGEGYVLPSNFIFGLNFSSTGRFSGTLTETQPISTPEPSSWTIILLGFGLLGWLKPQPLVRLSMRRLRK